MNNLAAPIFLPPVQALPELTDEALPLPLSQSLRVGTATSHKELENRLVLPGSIRSIADYRACLLRFYQLYRPIELQFQLFTGPAFSDPAFSEWIFAGFDPSACSLSARLAADLEELAVSVADISLAPAAALPPLREFASALGACYVLEGSALGSLFMLPQLRRVLGDGMDGADSFFRGRETETSAFWQRFRAALDRYGDAHPEQTPAVIRGANDTFVAIGLWMQP